MPCFRREHEELGIEVPSHSALVSMQYVYVCVWDLLVQECLSQRAGACQQSGPVEGRYPCWLSAGWDAWRGQTAPWSAYLSASCLPEPCGGRADSQRGHNYTEQTEHTVEQNRASTNQDKRTEKLLNRLVRKTFHSHEMSNIKNEWKFLPYMGKDILRESRLHEDVLYFVSADKSVHVSVSFQKDVVIATTVWHWHHPGHRMLKQKEVHILELSVFLTHNNQSKVWTQLLIQWFLFIFIFHQCRWIMW